jgi:hypothetical protein
LNLKSTFFAILGMSSMAIALPLLGTLGEGATFFVVHGAVASDILIFALCILLIPPILLLTVAAATQALFNERAGYLATIAALGGLATLWCLSLTKSMPTSANIAVSLLVGVGLGYGYYKRSDIRSLLRIIGQASPLILIFFLLFTPVKKLVLPEGVDFLGTGATAKTPIVMLILDELSLAALTKAEGEIDAGRLPNFARLADLSTWYQDTVAVATNTHRAIPAILASKRPVGDVLPLYSEFPQNFFSLLTASHEIRSSESVSRLCPQHACNKTNRNRQNEFSAFGMYKDAGYVWLHAIAPPAIAEQYLPPISHGWSNFSRATQTGAGTGTNGDHWYAVLMDKLVKDAGTFVVPGSENIHGELFEKFLAGIDKSKGASVNYLHATLPHHPWIFLPDGSIYNGESPAGTAETLMVDDSQYLANQRTLQYALQLEYVDKFLGRLLDKLEKTNRLDETLLIVIADHGVVITPNSARRIPEASTLADIARVPLFIKYPGQTSAKIDQRKAETLDILPTIVEVLGLQIKEPLHGQSLLATHWQDRQRSVFEAGDRIPDIEAVMDMQQARDRIYRALIPGKSALEALGLPQSRNLIGTPVPEQTATAEKLLLRIDNIESYADLDLKNDTLPVRLTGTLEGASGDTELVIAINGSVAGTGLTYDEKGSFTTLLQPRMLQTGRNRIAAFTRSGDILKEVQISGNQESP